MGSGAEPWPKTDFGVFWRPQNAPFCIYMTKIWGEQFALVSLTPISGGTCPPRPPWSTPMGGGNVRLGNIRGDCRALWCVISQTYRRRNKELWPTWRPWSAGPLCLDALWASAIFASFGHFRFLNLRAAASDFFYMKSRRINKFFVFFFCVRVLSTQPPYCDCGC